MKTLKRRAITLVVILFIMVAVGAVFAWVWLPKAHAQMVCGQVTGIFESLEAGYGEFKTAQGVVDSNAVLMRFTNPKTDSWTMVLVMAVPPQACMIASGTGWEVFEPELPEKESH